MTRRPWLVVVVLVLLGISVTTFVKSSRTYRPDDAFALGCDADHGAGGGDSAVPCVAPELGAVHAQVAILEDVPLSSPRVAVAAIITVAPKTSPPR